MSPGLAIAPVPPGRLGQAPDPTALLAYLRALRDWVAQRKRELDGLDAAAARSSDPDDHVGDLTLSMTLWQSVKDRCDRLDTLWDAGRADALTRERMTQVIWGRLDSGDGIGAARLALSVVEACRLSDALAAQLRNRLSFDPRASDASMRVAALRAALERLRELVKQEPSWSGQVNLIASRLDDVAVRAARGGDVSGVLRDLETDAARAERDLVVQPASRLRDARSREATSEVAALGHRRTRLLELVERCTAQITPAPRYAVPDVAVLGPVPQDRVELDAYTRRLDAVVAAMDVVEDAYGGPLAERQDLVGLLGGYVAMAERSGRLADPAAALGLNHARELLAARPCDVARARLAVTTFAELVRSGPSGGPSGPAAPSPPPASAAAPPAAQPAAPIPVPTATDRTADAPPTPSSGGSR